MYRSDIRRIARLVLATATLFVAQEHSASAQTQLWNVTWGRSPIKETIDQNASDPNLTLSNQTVREIIRSSIGGSTTRIHLSNLYGTAPLVISDVRLAASSGAASAGTLGTSTAVTFAGNTSVTIPIGQFVTSDAIAFTVAPLSDIAVSLYFPGTSRFNNLTSHEFAQTQIFYVSGDQTSAQSFTPLGTEARYLFLTGIDVQQPRATGTWVAFGASITDGFGSARNSNHAWPDLLEKRLMAAGFTLGEDEEGLAGGGTTGNPGLFGPGAEERIQQDALTKPGVRWMSYSDFPLNDLDANPNTSFDFETAGLQMALSQAHSAGIRVICSTLTPFGGGLNVKWTAQGESVREQYNTYVRTAGNGCDAVFDQALAIQDPNNPVQYAPPFGRGDGIHPNDVGYQILANAFDLSIFGTPPVGSPLIADGSYELVVRNSGEGTLAMVVDDPGARTTPGLQQELWTLNNAANQHWVLKNLGGDVVSLINGSTGLALQVAGGATSQGAAVEQNAYTGATSQQWHVESADTAWYRLVNVASGLVLDVPGGRTAAGTLLDQAAYTGSASQQWTFVQ